MSLVQVTKWAERGVPTPRDSTQAHYGLVRGFTRSSQPRTLRGPRGWPCTCWGGACWDPWGNKDGLSHAKLMPLCLRGPLDLWALSWGPEGKPSHSAHLSGRGSHVSCPCVWHYRRAIMSLRHSAGLHGQSLELPGWHSLILCHALNWRDQCLEIGKLGLLGFQLIPNLFQVGLEPVHLSLLVLSKLMFTLILALFALQLDVGHPQLRLKPSFGCSQFYLQLVVLSFQFPALCKQLLFSL